MRGEPVTARIERVREGDAVLVRGRALGHADVYYGIDGVDTSVAGFVSVRWRERTPEAPWAPGERSGTITKPVGTRIIIRRAPG